MTNIHELISELAPQGLKHVALAEVAIYSSTRVDAVELDETNFVGVDNMVSDKGGRVDASYLPNTARLTAYEPGDILIGNIRPYLKKVWLATNSGGCSGDVLALRVRLEHRPSLDVRFLYYLLSSDGFFAFDMRHSKGSKMPRGDKAAIMNYRIPLPPIEVQREIVRVLDQFNMLIVELEGELQARRKQRLALGVNFEVALRDASPNKFEVVKLGDLVRESISPVLLKDDEPYVTIGVRWNGEGVLFREPKRGSEIKAKTLYRVNPGQLVYNRMFVVEGSFAVVPPEARGAVVSGEFPAFDIDETKVHPQWLINFLTSRHTLSRIEKQVTGTERGSMKSRRRWKSNQFTDFDVLLPSLEWQLREVALLRKCDDLISELQAELKARHDQFEYYRDKLLTFEDAVA